MSGKSLTELSGEEWALRVAPLIIGLLCSAVGLGIVSLLGISISSPLQFVFKVGSVTGIFTFAILFPRILDLGYGFEEPKF